MRAHDIFRRRTRHRRPTKRLHQHLRRVLLRIQHLYLKNVLISRRLVVDAMVQLGGVTLPHDENETHGVARHRVVGAPRFSNRVALLHALGRRGNEEEKGGRSWAVFWPQ